VGTAGDVLPLLRIGRRLADRSHDVSLLTHFGYRGLTEEAGLEFAAVDDAAGHARSVEDGPLVNTPRGIVEFMRRHYLPQVSGEYEQIRERCRPSGTIVVARDLFDLGARFAAEKLGIPVVWIFISPSQLSGRELRLALYSEILAGDVQALRGSLGLPPVTDWAGWLKYPGRNVAIWPAWFAARDPAWPAEVEPVGFILDNEGERGEIPDELEQSLRGGQRPVLITGGSGTFVGAAFYEASVEACVRAHRSAILATPFDDLAPANLPRSIRRYSHLPMGKLMPRVDVVIHHGGRGTMSCALAAGTPQVVLASGADRPWNALRLEELGVARCLPRLAWTPEALLQALESTASTALRERCREIAGRFPGVDSVGAACRLIEKAGHRRPPAADLD
jgi:rhamnosyltransferase subunit B